MLKPTASMLCSADQFPTPPFARRRSSPGLGPWAQSFDANGLIALLRAAKAFDLRPQFRRIKAKVLYILSRTDQVFPPSIAPGVMAALKAAGVDASYVEVDSDIGHMAFGYQTEKWSPALKSFMAELTAARLKSGARGAARPTTARHRRFFASSASSS